jgi:hypothetical protein
MLMVQMWCSWVQLWCSYLPETLLQSRRRLMYTGMKFDRHG